MLFLCCNFYSLISLFIQRSEYFRVILGEFISIIIYYVKILSDLLFDAEILNNCGPTMIRNTKINWSQFTPLRNDINHKIEAAMCINCNKIIRTVSDQRLQMHR